MRGHEGKLPPPAGARVGVGPGPHGKIEVGAHVEANFRRAGTWYPGVIDKVHEKKNRVSYSVLYDDGDHEAAVSAKNVRAIQPAPAAPSSAQKTRRKKSASPATSLPMAQDVAHRRGAGNRSEDEEDACRVCGSAEGEDDMLLCDCCDYAFHTYCVGLDKVPRGQWFCDTCFARRSYLRQRVEKEFATGIFQGHVMAVNRHGFRVRYEDGDEEDMSPVRACLGKPSRTAPPPPADDMRPLPPSRRRSGSQDELQTLLIPNATNPEADRAAPRRGASAGGSAAKRLKPNPRPVAAGAKTPVSKPSQPAPPKPAPPPPTGVHGVTVAKPSQSFAAPPRASGPRDGADRPAAGAPVRRGGGAGSGPAKRRRAPAQAEAHSAPSKTTKRAPVTRTSAAGAEAGAGAASYPPRRGAGHRSTAARAGERGRSPSERAMATVASREKAQAFPHKARSVAISLQPLRAHRMPSEEVANDVGWAASTPDPLSTPLLPPKKRGDLSRAAVHTVGNASAPSCAEVPDPRQGTGAMRGANGRESWAESSRAVDGAVGVGESHRGADSSPLGPTGVEPAASSLPAAKQTPATPSSVCDEDAPAAGRSPRCSMAPAAARDVRPSQPSTGADIDSPGAVAPTALGAAPSGPCAVTLSAPQVAVANEVAPMPCDVIPPLRSHPRGVTVKVSAVPTPDNAAGIGLGESSQCLAGSWAATRPACLFPPNHVGSLVRPEPGALQPGIGVFPGMGMGMPSADFLARGGSFGVALARTADGRCGQPIVQPALAPTQYLGGLPGVRSMPTTYFTAPQVAPLGALLPAQGPSPAPFCTLPAPVAPGGQGPVWWPSAGPAVPQAQIPMHVPAAQLPDAGQQLAGCPPTVGRLSYGARGL